MHDSLLAVIETEPNVRRLALFLVGDRTKQDRLELHQQSWCPSVGWYTQSRFGLRAEEVRGLRSALGAGACGICPPAACGAGPHGAVEAAGPAEFLLRFPRSESA
jgi:hypothetical protein